MVVKWGFDTFGKPFRAGSPSGIGRTASAMLPFALFDADLNSAVHDGVRLVGCCYLLGGFVQIALSCRRFAVTRTRRKLVDLRRSKTRLAAIPNMNSAIVFDYSESASAG